MKDPLINIGVGIEFCVHLISNRQMFYKDFIFFEDHFTNQQLQEHFDFYEPLTVHESSLSPCIHSILASTLGRMDKAYEMYLRTSRLDLDDYNREVHEGLHITSMAGTWMSIVEGFGGMRVKNNQLYFNPQIPKEWSSYSFTINFRDRIITVKVTKENVTLNLKGEALNLLVKNESVLLKDSLTLKI